MALIDFGRLISFRQWFDRTNELANTIGDVDNINADLSASDMVDGINTLASNLGDVSTINPGINADVNPIDGVNSLKDAINELGGEIDRYRISEGEPLAYDMEPLHVFGPNDFDATGMTE